jgi:hypothetical protein
MSDDVFGDPKEKATALALELWNKRDFPSTGGKWRVERFADSVRIFDGRELLARFPLENWFDIKPNVIGLIEWHNNHLCAPGSGKCAGLASTANDSNPKSESVSASETRQEKGLRELIGRVMRHAHLTNGYRGDGQWQADINDLWDYVSGRSFLLATPTTREQPSEEIIYADGFCRRCSTLSYPLTRALEKVGVPTGADNWQQTWGPAKVLELEDYKNALRRLILAISGGDANDQKAALDNANFYFELHVKRYRERLKLAQREQQTPVREAQPSESALTPKGESQLAEEKWGAR